MESLVAITILIFAVTGAASAMQTAISSYIFSKDQIIAFYLAQEGFEQIRNIRDENKLKNQSWLTGLALSSGDPCWFGQACRVDPTDPVNGGKAISCGSPGSCPVLKKSSTGFYGYDASWGDTVFKREILLTQISATEVSVEVTVDWSKGLVNRQFKARENLLDWQ